MIEEHLYCYYLIRCMWNYLDLVVERQWRDVVFFEHEISPSGQASWQIHQVF